MNKLVSPSQIFCEKCEEMVISLLKASDRQQSQSDEDGLYEKTIDFLHSNLYLLRDMKMISAYAYLMWILVDFRISDNSYEKREEVTKTLENIVEVILDHAENEETFLCTLLRRMQIYFSIAAVYSKLKPVADLIIIEQCYMEAESIMKFADDMTTFEKKQALDLWEAIQNSHELRNVYTVATKKARWNESRANYLKTDPFEGGGLYAPPKHKEDIPQSYEPKRRKLRHRKKVNKVQRGDLEPAKTDIVMQTHDVIDKQKEVIDLTQNTVEPKILDEMSISDDKIEDTSNNDIIDTNVDDIESVENYETELANESDSNVSFEKYDEPPEIPDSEPPELNYEPVFTPPSSYITKSTLKNQPMFHPIMLPSDQSKSILPPLKIDPPLPDSTKNDIPVIVRKVIAEFNERITANPNRRDSKVNPITNLERTLYLLKD